MLVVTGAAGFLGTHVVQQAAVAGIDTYTVDRRRHAERRIDLVVDLAEPGEHGAELGDALASATAVIHLAGAGGVRGSGLDAACRRRRDNVLAARTVLELAPRDVPVVVASSSSVYGGATHDRPSREDDPPRPLGGYARSKLAVEHACDRRAATGGRVTVARPFTVVGGHQRADMALARWVDQALAGEPLTVFGDLRRSRDLTDAGDVASALIALAATAPQTTVNLGSGLPVALGAITAAVARVLGDTGTRSAAATPHEPAHTLADVRRCHQLLGFTPGSPDLDAAVATIAGERAAARRFDSSASA